MKRLCNVLKISKKNLRKENKFRRIVFFSVFISIITIGCKKENITPNDASESTDIHRYRSPGDKGGNQSTSQSSQTGGG